jgi:hypothetical protein
LDQVVLEFLVSQLGRWFLYLPVVRLVRLVLEILAPRDHQVHPMVLDLLMVLVDLVDQNYQECQWDLKVPEVQQVLADQVSLIVLLVHLVL